MEATDKSVHILWFHGLNEEPIFTELSVYFANRFDTEVLLVSQ